MKKFYLALIGLALLSSCDDLAVERDDVVRFDYKVAANSTSFTLSSSTVQPYETEELKKYKDERDQIKEYEIYRVEYRFYSFRVDNDSSLILGEAEIVSDQGTEFQMELFDTGDEYKDSENHELHSLKTSGSDGKEAYDKLAQEVVDADQFTINTSNLSGIVDSLNCDMSIYIHYKIKAN